MANRRQVIKFSNLVSQQQQYKLFSSGRYICEFHESGSVFGDIKVGAQNHNFSILLIFNKYNIMIVMLKFTFAISVECLHSSLQANFLMQNCTCKTCKNFYM